MVIVIDGLLRAWNWRQLLLAMRLSSEVPYGKVLACFWSAAFLGQVVPSTAGTDALRALLGKRTIGGPMSAHVAAIVMLNAISLFAGCVVGLTATLFLGLSLAGAAGVRPFVALLFGAAVIGASCAYLLVKYQRGLVIGMLRRLRGRKLRKLRHGLRRFIDRLLVFERRGAHALPVFAIACCTLLTRAVAFALAGAAVHVSLPLLAWGTIVTSTMLSGLLPYSVAGYGGDQAAIVYFLSGFGVLPSDALAFALFLPLVPMFFNLLGGIPVLLGKIGSEGVARDGETVDTAS
jgi:uncharacterized membrane protein YbhN (UPF0104 family)